MALTQTQRTNSFVPKPLITLENMVKQEPLIEDQSPSKQDKKGKKS